MAIEVPYAHPRRQRRVLELYLDANGRNATIWPGFTWRFWQQTRHSTSPPIGSRTGPDGLDGVAAMAPTPG
ncbi:MAG: hypothetical protein JO304_26465 [Solirubrobacterales bacterium]|nr:hypothetical protein [Solirubrobacterales bacterium]